MDLDWITLLIEAVGVVILLLWIVIPIREFRAILKKIRSRAPERAVVAASADRQRGFEVTDAPDDRGEPRR